VCVRCSKISPRLRCYDVYLPVTGKPQHFESFYTMGLDYEDLLFNVNRRKPDYPECDFDAFTYRDIGTWKYFIHVIETTRRD